MFDIVIAIVITIVIANVHANINAAVMMVAIVFVFLIGTVVDIGLWFAVALLLILL